MNVRVQWLETMTTEKSAIYNKPVFEQLEGRDFAQAALSHVLWRSDQHLGDRRRSLYAALTQKSLCNARLYLAMWGGTHTIGDAGGRDIIFLSAKTEVERALISKFLHVDQWRLL